MVPVEHVLESVDIHDSLRGFDASSRLQLVDVALLETDQRREQLMKPVHVRGRGCVAWSPFGLGFMFLP